MDPVPALVTLHVWRVAARRVPAAMLRVATGRRLGERVPGMRFAKLLGTGAGRTFTPRDADPCRWALLATWESTAAADAFGDSALARSWRQVALERWRVDLVPMSSRGCWSGRAPFGSPVARGWTGPVAAITRARLVLRQTVTFWRSVPPVCDDLLGRPGLRAAFGVGEAPVGLQGTFSVWDSETALRDFAYSRPAHAAVIRRTAERRWYAEELFARFAVVGSAGTLSGTDPARSIGGGR